jgi:hypothetical protein
MNALITLASPLIVVLNRRSGLCGARVNRSKRTAAGFTLFHAEPNSPAQLQDESASESSKEVEEELRLLQDEEELMWWSSDDEEWSSEDGIGLSCFLRP